jgi:ADP-heptose:LPS heptosyltransferase
MPAKRWPAERFESVARTLVDRHDLWPVVFGGREDMEAGANLLKACGRGYNAAGQLGVRAAAVALGRCRFYVGNDTGTMHLAAAGGAPCVAVFSSRDWPGAWDPYGVDREILRTQIDCQGCYLEECVTRKNECLTRISTTEVLQACESLIERNLPSQAPGLPR